ncbi:MAG: MarR family winged helix-turn-helix transcriptional regulator [Bacteroidales bacterium]|jgi:DNA-binding MarR family transcriptional regulator|nr:MarR family winged helix-turn-helix transcriptional regulator [Bacteroidales bacterium]
MNTQATVDFHLRSSLFSMMRMYNLLASQNGITQGVGYVLLIIEKSGTPATKVAPLMGMSSSSLSRLLKNMENTDLIYKESNSSDKRVVKVFLTEKGVELRREVKRVVLDFNNNICERISKEDFDVFAKVTTIIKEQVQADLAEFQLNNNLKK